MIEHEGIQDSESWFPKDYTPGISVDAWKELLSDSTVFNTNALTIMKRMYDYGGQASCTQLAIKYGETANFYNVGSSTLARRVADKTGCKVPDENNENPKWWPILYMGKNEKDGTYTWRLRDELKEALKMTDLSNVPLHADAKPAIWKISEGTDSTGIALSLRQIFLKRQVVVVHSTTKAKGSLKYTQGQAFTDYIKKGDYFYLCFGNSVQLLGQFTEDKSVENPEKKDGWCERSYRVIAQSKNDSAYTGMQKWWSPNDNSTCIKVDESEHSLFEECILKPYFGMTVDELFDQHLQSPRYWWLTANPKIWSFADIEVGGEQKYTLYNENGNKRQVFQNFLNVKVGDIVIGYESAPVKKIKAICRITQASDGECIRFTKSHDLTVPIDYATLKGCPELNNMAFFKHPNGSLFDLPSDEFYCIMNIIRECNPIDLGIPSRYMVSDFLSDVYMSEERYNILTALLKNKKNIILQGAPGVGKTFAAKRLAYSMMGVIDDSRIEFVQFHQNYSYEDFVMGYRPDDDKFKLTEGIFYRFCRAASNDTNHDYFFIIDEINRGNMSKIFGELLMLIEKSYRGTKATLAYSDIPFSVPDNLYIIGMMNTADRSLAMIDYALRRRFSFFEMEPAFDSDGFKRYQDDLDNEMFKALIEQIKQLNKEIADDPSLGRGFRIGHSYFCDCKVGECTKEWMYSVVEFDIIPMLEEYWFDEPDKLQRWKDNLRGVLND